MCQTRVVEDTEREEPSAVKISATAVPITIGLDIAKNFFQVHGVDATGQVVVRKRLRRAEVLAFCAKLPPCLIGMEACASSHH